MAIVAKDNRTHWVKSPKAVSPKLRGASKDTRTCAQTTAHTGPVHLPGCRTESELTLRVYCHTGRLDHYGSNRPSITEVCCPWLSHCGHESSNKAENVVVGIIQRHRRGAESIWLRSEERRVG